MRVLKFQPFMDIIRVQLVLNTTRKASRMNKASSRKISIFLTGFILLVLVAIVPPSLYAAMNELSDSELVEINGAGFSNFTLQTVGNEKIFNVTLNITASTYADIASLKMGYYDKKGLGWDEDWTGVKLGTPTNDLVATGLYIEAGYDAATFNNPATRTLDYIKIGTPSLSGSIAATFNSLSYIKEPGSVYRERITTVGNHTYTGAGQEFYLLLTTGAAPGTKPGFYVRWPGVIT